MFSDGMDRNLTKLTQVIGGRKSPLYNYYYYREYWKKGSDRIFEARGQKPLF